MACGPIDDMAHQVDVPGGASGPVAEPAAAEQPHQCGLTVAMALRALALALPLGIPVYLGQRGHMTRLAPMPPYPPPATSGKRS